MTAILDMRTIAELSGGRLGTFDVRCVLCGPGRHSSKNQLRHVMRIWRLDASFCSFHCARCGAHGSIRDSSGVRIAPSDLTRVRAEAAARERDGAARGLAKAHWLWSQSRPIFGSVAERYLREVRGCRTGELPATLRFLPARGQHCCAMVAAIGIPAEPEPGKLEIALDAIRGVHITRLAQDGSGKAGTVADKIMVGRSLGSPIVLAPPNDLLAIGVTEGIEDALAVHIATGLGGWAAGSASRLPALAAAVPYYIECVTIFAHPDAAGQRGAYGLADGLVARGIETRIEGGLR